MNNHLLRRRTWLNSLCVLWILIPTMVRADDEAPIQRKPIGVINVGGLDRALSDLGGVFESADRAEVSDLIGGYLAKVNDLKGVNRTKPFGIMFFLDSTDLPPSVKGVQYFPVDNLDDVLSSLGKVSLKPSKTEGKADHYELKTPGPTLHAVV